MLIVSFPSIKRSCSGSDKLAVCDRTEGGREGGAPQQKTRSNELMLLLPPLVGLSQLRDKWRGENVRSQDSAAQGEVWKLHQTGRTFG